MRNGLDDRCSESSGADPSPRNLWMGNSKGMTCSAQGGAFNRIMTRERDTATRARINHSICATQLLGLILPACGSLLKSHRKLLQMRVSLSASLRISVQEVQTQI